MRGATTDGRFRRWEVLLFNARLNYLARATHTFHACLVARDLDKYAGKYIAHTLQQRD